MYFFLISRDFHLRECLNTGTASVFCTRTSAVCIQTAKTKEKISRVMDPVQRFIFIPSLPNNPIVRVIGLRAGKNMEEKEVILSCFYNGKYFAFPTMVETRFSFASIQNLRTMSCWFDSLPSRFLSEDWCKSLRQDS